MPKTIKYTTKGEGYAKYCNKVCPHTGVGIGSTYCVSKCENCLSWDKADKIVVCGFGDEEVSDRDVPCGNKHCQEYWEELINHCEVTSSKRDGVCPNYTPDPTETAIKIQDCRGNVPDNRGAK